MVFSILVLAAMGTEPSLASASLGFVCEAGGGALIGLLAGWVVYRATRSIGDYNVEVMISLAVVMGGYSLAHWLHVSGPVAMAVAGLLIGNAGVAHVMSGTTKDYLLKFWALIDDILTAFLFLLIGLEVVAIGRTYACWRWVRPPYALVILARTVAVGAPLLFLRRTLDLGPLAIPTLVWGGRRGGISIGLALSLERGEVQPVLLGAACNVVLFAVIVQGGNVGCLIRRLSGGAAAKPAT